MSPVRRLPPTDFLFFTQPGRYEFSGELPNAKTLRICLDIMHEEFIDEEDNAIALWGLEGSMVLSSPTEEKIHSIALKVLSQGDSCWIGSWHPIMARPGVCENCTEGIPYELMGVWGNQTILDVSAYSNGISFNSWYVSTITTPPSP